MKDCRKIHPMLALHADGALTPSEAARVEAHLAQCAEAREELARYQKLRKSMASLPEPPIPGDLHAKIMERLGAKPAARRRPFLLPLPAWGLAAAACLTLFLLRQDGSLTRFDQAKFRSSAPPAEEKKVPQPFVAQKKEVGGLDHTASTNTSTFTNTATNGGAADKEKDSSRSLELDRAVKRPEAAEVPSVAGYAAPAQEPERPRAKAAKKAKRTEQRDEVRDLTLAGQAPAAAGPGASQRVDTMADSAKPAASSTNLGLESALAPQPTPVPTEGAFKTLELSKKVTTSTWSGLNAPATQESAELVTDADAFTKIWAALRPGQTPPTVDFGSQAVVFLQAGEKPAAGYDIRVSRLEEQDDQLLVHYQVLTLSVNGASAQVLTRPWSLQVIPKPSKPVVFQKD